MIVLSANQINKSYGTDIILEDVSFNVEKGDRIGIVGANGEGKTTLLNILANELDASSGNVYVRNEYTIGYLKQRNHFFSEGKVIDEASKTFTHLYNMEAEIEKLHEKISDHNSPSFEKDLEKYTALMEEFEKQGGYTYKSELVAVLNHMGFDANDQNKEISKLSGGERTRLALSCMLLAKPDILLLDEPTNHLDLKMLAWLETYLKNYQGTILVVSHDRYFLDHMVNKIFDISAGKLMEYAGNYSTYLDKKQARLKSMQSEYEKQQKEIARQEEMIRRFKQHGTEHLAKRAASREKRLSHLDIIEKPHEKQKNIKLGFEQNYKSGGEVLTAENLSKSFGNQKLFENVNMNVRKGERICIIGDNGVGKTTLLKILIGKEDPDSGYLKAGYNVNFGYYDQGQRMLDENETVLGEIHNSYHLYSETELRNLLGRFLFHGDDVFKTVASLSGGEKAKLSLLKLMLSGANTLIFDEPTNHLDIESKEAVEKALQEFDGTIILVSHDRYLLTKIPDRILELTQDGIVEYKGNFEYYQEKNIDKDKHEHLDKAEEQVQSSETSRQAKKQAEAEARRRNRQSDEIENRIHELECLIMDIEIEIADPEKAMDFEWLDEKSRELAKYENEVSKLYDEWMDIQ